MRRKRKLLVEILAFCLMSNHIHLLVRQLQDKGISRFTQKLVGYPVYYNKKYGRTGHLFQGKYRSVHIENNEQLKTVFVYIHTNPVSIMVPKWREAGVKDAERVMKFLEDYQWSSYRDYLGKHNFPSLTQREFLLKTMGGVEGCKEFVEGWIKYKKEIKDSEKIFLE